MPKVNRMMLLLEFSRKIYRLILLKKLVNILQCKGCVKKMNKFKKNHFRETGIWVTYKEGVYDITEFVEGHPGGDQILMAAGNSVEPFWLLYGIHENANVYEILETYRIGKYYQKTAGKCNKNKLT